MVPHRGPMLMMDDPLFLLMQGIWLLAAGMYPLGFLFGTCSACCNQCRNDTCEGFDLDEAFGGTRTSGRLEYCQTFTPGPNLLSLSFSATCFGGGATGTVEGLGEPAGPAPLVSVSLTNGGSGYARLGRQAPTLSIGNSNTTPADVTISFSQTQGECDLDFWSVDSITVNNGGEGYTDGDGLTLTAAEGSTVVAGATGTISTLRVQPTITASTASGTGATFTVSITAEDVAPDPLTWKITGVTFSGTTSGFVDGEPVTFSGDNLVEVASATATVVTKRVEPQLSAEIPFPFSGGSGAVLAVTLASNNDDPETWSVDDVQITSAGTGYVEFDVVYFSVISGTEENSGYAYVSQVDGNGGIIAIFIQGGGTYYEIGDELDFIQLDEGGLFYRDNGTIASIAITDGGSYYDEDPSLTPYVETPTVTVQQIAPSAGSGAQVTAVVDDDTASATFGEVISLTLDDAGIGYLAFRLVGNWEYVGDGVFEFQPETVGFRSNVTGISAGCRVYGPGIAPGTVVTNVDGIYDPPKSSWTFEKQGCCEVVVVYRDCIYSGFDLLSVDETEKTVVERIVRTSSACDERQQTIAPIVPTGLYQETCPNPRPSGFQGHRQLVSVTRTFTECLDCSGNPVGSVRTDNLGTTEALGYEITIDPPPSGEIGPCLSFCGTGGKCGGFTSRSEDDEAYGPYGAGEILVPGDNRGCCTIEYEYRNCEDIGDEQTGPTGDVITDSETALRTEEECQARADELEETVCIGWSQFGGPYGREVISVNKTWVAGFDCEDTPLQGPVTFYPTDYRRNCVRWVCRCYEGTGKKDLLDEDTGDPLFPEPSDWYTVESTTVVGGPTTNDLDLGEELETATGSRVGNPPETKIEHDHLFGFENWDAAEGDTKCVVWAFAFYGESLELPRECSTEYQELNKETISGDNVYFIKPCNRCD